MISNLREKYNPQYFLAALGNGGMSVAFFMYLMFMVDHPGRPMANFEHVYSALFGNNIYLSITVVISLLGIIFFGFNHFRLLIWNIKEFKQFKSTSSYEKLMNSNSQMSLMVVPLTLSMSVNVLFIIAGVFIPNLWDIVEYLFPGAIVAFTLIGIYALDIFLKYFTRFITNGDFNFMSNNNLSSMIPIFAFFMISVGFSSSVAMSHELTTVTLGLIGSLFFGSLGVVFAVIKFMFGFKSIFKHGIDPQGSPSLLIIIPMLTIMGITFVRLYMGVSHNLLHIKEPTPIVLLLVLTIFLSIQVIFGLIGLKVLNKTNYFKNFINGSDKSVGSYALICPGVAFFVLGMFIVHKGFVESGILEQFNIIYFLILLPFLFIKLKTIQTMFKLNKKLLTK